MNQQVASLLWLGIEDYTGLWEAMAEVRSAQPTLTRTEAQKETATLILALAQSGWIRLFLCDEPMNAQSITELPADQYENLRTDSKLWDPPKEPGVESVRYATMDAGLSAYRDFVGWKHI